MSWGTDLWDQFENLDKHSQWGIDFLERYAKFVKERLEIEQTYAKQLRSLVKKYCPKRPKDDEPRFTSCLSFYSILNELNDYAGQREVVAEEMGHKVYGELMRYSQDLKAERKHHLQEGRKAQQYLDQCWKHMDNSKKKFERECKEAEKSQLIYERLDNDINATKSEVEKAKSQLYLRQHMAEESKNEYAAQLQNFNSEQWKHFNVAIPQIFKNLQDMDERRTVKLGEMYRSFAEVERRVIPIISKCLEGMVTAAKNVNERRVGDKDDGFGGFSSPFQSEVHAQTQSYDEAITEEDLQLIQERESAIRQLESDITDINEIFRDLGLMVHEQGDMIDSIEANVSNAEINVQSATQQLNRAASHQTSFRKKIFILIAVLIVLAVIIGLIIWASVKK